MKCIRFFLFILVLMNYSCEKIGDDNSDPTDNDNSENDSMYYQSEWADPITTAINGFACEAYRDIFIIGGRYLYTYSDSTELLTTLYQDDTFFTGIHVISDQEIITVGLDGKALETTDGGLTWQSMNPGTSADLKDCYFFDANRGFVIGNNSCIKKTDDGGSNWEEVSFPFNYYLEDILFTNDSTGYLGCGGSYVGEDFGYSWELGHIYKTCNAGSSWEPKLSTSTLVTSINFPDEKTGFAVTVTGDAFKSSDSGETWNKIIDSDSIDYGFKTVKFITTDIGFISGIDWQHPDCPSDGALILKTLDGGDTWSVDYNGCLNGYTIEDIAFNADKGIAITGNHIIPCKLY